MLIRLVGTH